MYKPAFIRDLVDIIYPEACLGCQQPLVTKEEMLCSYCLAELPKTNYHKIPENEVTKIFTGRCKLEKASSYLYFSKGGMVQALLHQFKYKGNKEVGRFAGRMMGTEFAATGFLDDIDWLVPVPLHPKKLKKRGFNQSEVLAKAIGEVTDVAVSTENLLRVSHSETQTKKSRFARWKNVESIFDINDAEAFRHKHVMLVDDVITTGSTLEASATKLAAIEGTKVSVLTLAVAK